jgi:hypothetical protein
MSASALVTVIFTTQAGNCDAALFKSSQQVVEAGRAALDDYRRPGKAVALASERVNEVHLDRGVGFQIPEGTRRPYIAEADRAIVEHDEGGLWRDVGCAIRIDRRDEAEALLADYPLHVSCQHRLALYLCLPRCVLTVRARVPSGHFSIPIVAIDDQRSLLKRVERRRPTLGVAALPTAGIRKPLQLQTFLSKFQRVR